MSYSQIYNTLYTLNTKHEPIYPGQLKQNPLHQE
jgi:hypothetical protein